MKFSTYAAFTILSGSALANGSVIGTSLPSADLHLQTEVKKETSYLVNNPTELYKEKKSNSMNKRSIGGPATPKLIKRTDTNSNVTIQQFNVTSNSTGASSNNSTNPEPDGASDSSAAITTGEYKYSYLAAAIGCVFILFML